MGDDVKRCPKCGRAVLWLRGHECASGGSAERLGPVEVPPAVEERPKKPKGSYARTKRWREKHPEEYRRLMREHMRKLRAKRKRDD